MNRKDFVKNCGMACLGGGVVAALLQGCGIAKTVTGTISGSDLILPATSFETRAGNETYYKKYLIVNHDKLKFPICIYRTDALQYTALWLQCTHQGAELQVFGDKLQCPAHGSEFDSRGNITGGPANKNLRTFPVTVTGNQLNISLKAV